MRFLSDENFRWDVMLFLKAQGHDVKVVPKRSMDRDVVNLAKKEKRVLLTNDNDFSKTFQFPPQNYSGILVFRIHPPSFEKYKQVLESFLSVYDPKLVNGKTFVIEENVFFEID